MKCQIFALLLFPLPRSIPVYVRNFQCLFLQSWNKCLDVNRHRSVSHCEASVSFSMVSINRWVFWPFRGRILLCVRRARSMLMRRRTSVTSDCHRMRRTLSSCAALGHVDKILIDWKSECERKRDREKKIWYPSAWWEDFSPGLSFARFTITYCRSPVATKNVWRWWWWSTINSEL